MQLNMVSKYGEESPAKVRVKGINENTISERRRLLILKAA